MRSVICAVIIGIAVSAPLACGVGSDCDFGLCAGPPADGVDGGGGDTGDAIAPDAVVPQDCDENADALTPAAAGCVVDSFALFVDGETGDDNADGSKAKPVKTIGSAIAKVTTTGKRRIYVCGSGTYPEHVKLTTAASLYGSFACKTWAPTPNLNPKIAPTDKGYALHIDEVLGSIVVSDVELAAADMGALKDGTSSVAVFVNKAANVTFLRTAMRASNSGEGAPGAVGGAGVLTAVSSGTVDLNGNPGSGAAGGLFKVCTCSSSSSTTTGGVGGSNGSGGGAGEPNHGGAAPKNGAAGTGNLGTCNGAGSGSDGADAPSVANAAAPTKRGALGPTGWEPTKGADGTESGKPGQGGGGGGAINSALGGAGGGCGGCGGFAGKGSGGGGASIALLVHESTVNVTGGALETKAGGAGGAAGAGGAGAQGGITGAAGQCAGGKGGRGADGSAGAGGAGGVSIGVLYKGAAPVIDSATTIAAGSPGAGGKGGRPGNNDGPTSLAEKTKDATQL